jgi:hypothetical protein
VVTVTDSSNRTATSAPLTVNTVNYAPIAEWSTANNSSVTGRFSVSAVAVPQIFGTAWIKKVVFDGGWGAGLEQCCQFFLLGDF